MPERIHRLFFALRPDAPVVGEIERVVETIKAGGNVRGRWVKPLKHHLTVQFLGTHDGRRVQIIEQARVAAAQVKFAPFEIVLDRVGTFGGHRQSPCVLRCTPDSDTSVLALRAVLGRALAAAGLADLLQDRFTPHVTIAYVSRHLEQPIAISPIAWQVGEFVLVESRVGESRHDVLDRWTLSP